MKGPDAARFLDLLYTGVMSSLPVGRCRYGLMCNDDGWLFDDGVVARLSDDSFLCHTTSGGSDRVHAWMEEWLQTEWPDLRVYVANLTEQSPRSPSSARSPAPCSKPSPPTSTSPAMRSPSCTGARARSPASPPASSASPSRASSP